MAGQVVHFSLSDDEGSCLFQFPGGAQLQVSTQDVERSCPLRNMLDSTAASEETSIALPTDSELSHLHNWATAVQTDSPAFQSVAKGFQQYIEV